MDDRKRRKLDQDRDSKTRRKLFQIPDDIAWGKYDVKFPTFDNKGIIELRDFLIKLDQHAGWAQTRQGILHQIMAKLCKSKRPLEIIGNLPEELSPFPEEDVVMLDGSDALTKCLSEKFSKPLLHRVSQPYCSLGTRRMMLDEFWSHLLEHSDMSIDVYDYSMEEPARRTRTMKVAEVLSYWKIPANDRSALNLLDIENRIGDFCPTEIIQSDLDNRVSRRLPHNIGKTSSNWKSTHREFFLLSGANAISSIHVDNAGQLTWVLILSGRKIWYFPRKITSQAAHWLAAVGSQYSEEYEAGWAKVELRAGDLLIMPSYCAHAVFTTEDCLAVGGQFYTASHLGSSLHGLKLQEDFPDVCNEGLNHKIYERLTTILDNFDAISTTAQQAEVILNCSLFLENRDFISLEALFEIIKPKKIPNILCHQYAETIEKLKSVSLQTQQFKEQRTGFLKALQRFKERALKKGEEY